MMLTSQMPRPVLTNVGSRVYPTVHMSVVAPDNHNGLYLSTNHQALESCVFVRGYNKSVLLVTQGPELGNTGLDGEMHVGIYTTMDFNLVMHQKLIQLPLADRLLLFPISKSC